MAKLGDMTLPGKSGKSYSFAVYDRNTSFKELGAVYLMSKRTPKSGGGGTHAYIYVGQTGDLSSRPLNHHKTKCFDNRGANCVSVHLESSEKRRLEIEADLITNHELPCND